MSQKTFARINQYFVDSISEMNIEDLVYVYGGCPLGKRGKALVCFERLQADKKIILRTAIEECVEAISGVTKQKYVILVEEDKFIGEFCPDWNNICQKTDCLLVVFRFGKIKENIGDFSNIRILEGNANNIIEFMKEVHARREDISITGY